MPVKPVITKVVTFVKLCASENQIQKAVVLTHEQAAVKTGVN